MRNKATANNKKKRRKTLKNIDIMKEVIICKWSGREQSMSHEFVVDVS